MSDSARAAQATITSLLTAWSAGDRGALDRMLPLVYSELRRLAGRQLRRLPGERSLDPSDLVHALFFQLVDQRHATWQNRAQFYAVAAQMMRRILVDHARSRMAAKRGGSAVNVSLTSLVNDPSIEPPMVAEVLAIDRALERLAVRDPDQARIVELRFFAGLTVEETAHVMGCSDRTIKREWRVARAWLFRELRGAE